jgi:DNA-binding transcriptional LysR family regulator
MGARSTSRPLDLNLVRVFVAVYETGSVTLAAERMFMTQPSVSYGLARLRDAMQDPLFIRTADGMAPTLLAKDIYADFRKAVGHVEDGLAAAREFDPATSERRFRVSMSDLAAMIFVPPLIAELALRSPLVELEVVELPVEEVPTSLAAGKIDAAIGNLPSILDLTTNASLFHETYVCLVRAGHPLARGKKPSISMKSYMAAQHVYVASRSSGHHMFETRLRELGQRRKIALQMQHFTALMTVLTSTDLIATLPSKVGKLFASNGSMQVCRLPFESPSIDMRLHWHGARERNAGLQWFLGSIRRSVEKLTA